MKSLLTFNFLLFISLATFSFSCESSKKVNGEINSKSIITKISLEKISMAGRETETFTAKHKESNQSDRSGIGEAVRTEMIGKNWNELENLASKIDLTQMPNWEGPTQERFHDGARATTISIESNGEIISSQSFDEGNPPAELKELYDLLESL